jgi:hypothetical protein
MENTSKLLLAQYKNTDLVTLIHNLEQHYYNVIESLCITAQKQAMRLQELETHQSTSQYVSLCKRLIEDIQKYIVSRKSNVIPYIIKLTEKQKDNHDCANCEGGCKLQHDVNLAELKDSHKRIKDTLNRLQMAALPLYSETIYPDVYRVLRNQMALLENSLTELFFIEDAYLIPKVIEAQNIIHAGSN